MVKAETSLQRRAVRARASSAGVLRRLGRLFRLAVSGHASAVNVDLPVSPHMVDKSPGRLVQSRMASALASLGAGKGTLPWPRLVDGAGKGMLPWAKLVDAATASPSAS